MPKAKDWTSFISEESKARQPSPLKALANYLSTPGLISLGGGYIPLPPPPCQCRCSCFCSLRLLQLVELVRLDGANTSLPNPGYFPFEYVDVRVPGVGKFDESQITTNGSTIRIIKNKNHIPVQMNGVNGKDGENGAKQDEVVLSETYPTDLSTTLQYAQGFGNGQRNISRYFH